MTGKVVTLMRTGAVRGGLRLDGVDKALIFGTTGTVLLNVAQLLLNFVLTLSLAHVLGASGVGAFAYALAWASVLAVPAVLGLTPLVIRNVAAYRAREEWGLLRGFLARANHAVLLSSAVLVVGGAIVCLVVNKSRPEFLYPVLGALLLVPIFALTSIRQAAMQGLGRVVVGRTPETLVAPALFIALIGIAWALGGDSFSATWAVGLQVTASLAALAIGVVLLRRVLPHRVSIERPQYQMNVWIRSAIPLLLFSLIQALNAQVEVLLLGAIDGATSAGIYTIAARVSGLATFVLLAVGYPLSPLIARLHANGDTVLLRRIVRRAATVVFLLSLPLAAGVLLFSHTLLGLFGNEFESGVDALAVLTLGQIGFAAMGFAGTVLVMTGHESLLVRGMVVGVVLNISLNVLLIPPYGINGAAVASTVAMTVANLWIVYYARRRAGIPSAAFGL